MTPIEIASKVLDNVYNLGIPNTYMIVPCMGVPQDTILNYWSDLKNANTLRYRWSDMFNPTVSAVMDRMENMAGMYSVIDCNTGEMVADFALENKTGRAIQVHFSTHPDWDSAKRSMLADQVSDQILYYWKDINNMEQAYVDTIFGITPVNNRVACIFVLKSGFKKLGILPSGTTYLGKVTDALITIKTRH